jgi:hypothetical protein
VIRPRGGTTRRRDDEEDDAASSAEEIGRQLRARREERQLDLLTVHDRLGRPITQIEALEQGDLAGLPDQAMALSTLRRYAAFLGLDGDALALQMIDAWSAAPDPRPAAALTGVTAVTASAAVTNVVTAVGAEPDHLRAFTQTGEVPRVGGGSSGPPTGSGAYGYGVNTGPPTGTFPVVPRQDLKQSRRAVAKARRRLRAPKALRVATWVAAGLVLVVVAGFAIYRAQPTWLVQAHILRVARPGAGGATTRSTTAQQAQPKAQVVQTGATGTSASYSVGTQHFDVVIATSNRCWVQVTSSSSSIPLVSGIQPAGKTLTIPATGTMTVEVGNTAVVLGISIGKKPVFLNAPHAIPFYYTFVPTPTT